MKAIDFSGKTAVVTGAASGMGRKASMELSRLGATVVMCDVNQKALDEACAEIARAGGRAYSCAADVRRYSDAQAAAALAESNTGRIDLLFTFAGGWEPRMLNSYKPFYEQPIDVIDWGIDVNFKGAVYFVRACMPLMIRRGGGVICVVGSVAGFESEGQGPMYGASKSALFNFVKGLSQIGAPHGVRAFCVSPGPVMTRPGMATMKTLLGRAAEPEEVVDYILYLASENGAFVTGSNHVIDGGRLAMVPQ